MTQTFPSVFVQICVMSSTNLWYTPLAKVASDRKSLSPNHPDPAIFPDVFALKVVSPVVRYAKETGATVIDVDDLVSLFVVGQNLNMLGSAYFVYGHDCYNKDGAVALENHRLKFLSDQKIRVDDLKFSDRGGREDSNVMNLCLEYKAGIVSLVNESDVSILPTDVLKVYLLPQSLQISIIVVLSLLSGLFSGLNLGLMSLTPDELQLVISAGTDPKQAKYAKTIMPIRRQGNFLLCSLVFGNVLVNTAISILFNDVTGEGSQLYAIVLSTFVIVIFGEIVPQSVCQRYSLVIGAKTIYVTIFFMFVTAPLSWPIGKILDLLLHHEFTRSYNRDRLYELIRTQIKTDLEHAQGPELQPMEGDKNLQEMKLVQGCLAYSKKTVKEIMTDLSCVFMLEANDLLDRDKLLQISVNGFTRIPVYRDSKENIVHILNVKDLALLDPDDEMPVSKVAQVWSRPVVYVDENQKLTDLLTTLKGGDSHLLIVRDGAGVVVGLVTLEDIIETIMGSEIVDEYDTGDRVKKHQGDVYRASLHIQKQVRAAKKAMRKVLGPKITKRRKSSRTEKVHKKLARTPSIKSPDEDDETNENDDRTSTTGTL